MEKWIVTNADKEQDALLKEILKGGYWPKEGEGTGKGKSADDGGMANSSSRVTSASDDIHEFNRIVVHSPLKPKRQYTKLVRHNCLQGMMDDGLIDDDNALITHLRFFSDTRNQELQQKHQTTRPKISRDGDLCGRYDKEFLRDYFDDDDDDDN